MMVLVLYANANLPRHLYWRIPENTLQWVNGGPINVMDEVPWSRSEVYEQEKKKERALTSCALGSDS